MNSKSLNIKITIHYLFIKQLYFFSFLFSFSFLSPFSFRSPLFFFLPLSAFGTVTVEDCGVEASRFLLADLVDRESHFLSHAFCNSGRITRHSHTERVPSYSSGCRVGTMAIGVPQRSVLHCIVHQCNRWHAEARTRRLVTFNEKPRFDKLPVAINH
jgi:hypothetical protein